LVLVLKILSLWIAKVFTMLKETYILVKADQYELSLVLLAQLIAKPIKQSKFAKVVPTVK